MAITPVPPDELLRASATGAARGHVFVRDGTRFRSRHLGYIDVRDYGAVGNDDGAGGGADDTAAIQAALTAAPQDAVVVLGGGGGSRLAYRITDTLTIKTGQRIWGFWPGSMGNGAVKLNFYGTDAKHCIATPAASNFSRLDFQGFEIVDRRTSSSRTGCGIYVDHAYNGLTFKHLVISNFYDNIAVVAPTTGQDNDLVHIQDVFLNEPLRYGINLTKISNTTLIEHVGGDTDTGTGLALIRIAGSNGSNVFTIESVKHECGNGAHTLQIEDDPTVVALGITMRRAASAGAGGDVVHISGNGNGVELAGITSSNTAYGDLSTVATNLVNVVGTGLTIAPSTNVRRLGFWSGGSLASQGQGGYWINNTRLMAGTGAPESVITAPPGSIWHRQDGSAGNSLYVKQSGTSNTGWGAVPTKLTGSKTFDWASIADGARAATTVTVTGAALGDTAVASMSMDLQGMEISAHVSAADTVAVVLRNGTGSAIDLASGTLKAVVTKA